MKTLFTLAAISLLSLPTAGFAQRPMPERRPALPAPKTQPQDTESASSVTSWNSGKMGTFAGTWSLVSVMIHPDPRLGNLVIMKNKMIDDAPMLAFTIKDDAITIDALLGTVAIELAEGPTPDKASLKFTGPDGRKIYSTTLAATCVGLKPKRKTD